MMRTLEPQGLGDGILHFIIIFANLFNFWIGDTVWSAKYKDHGMYHYCLQFVQLFLIIGASSCVEDVYKLEHGSGRRNWWWFIAFCFGGIAVWAGQYAQLALYAADANTWKEASFVMVSWIGELVMLAAAWVCASYPEEDGMQSAMLTLLFVTPWIYPLRAMAARLASSPEMLARAHEFRTPINVNSLVHRFNEFQMLMLGETVLQLVISDWPPAPPGVPTNAGDMTNLTEDDQRFMASTLFGLIIVLSMLHSHVHTYPDSPDNHAAKKGTICFYLFLAFFMLKAAFVLLTGVGVKPPPPPSSPRSSGCTSPSPSSSSSSSSCRSKRCTTAGRTLRPSSRCSRRCSLAPPPCAS